MFNSIKKNLMKNLVFLTMMFGLMMVFSGIVSAQQNCGNPKENQVIIYEHIFSQNGGGKCIVLEVGEYPKASQMKLADNIMSSIKVGKGVIAQVCDGENFTGSCEIFDKDDADLRNNPTIKNDIASSVKVIKVDQTKSSKVCPGKTGAKVPIAWKNDTGKTLRINWVNYECKEEKNTREIKPGQTYDGDSYEGHVFYVRDWNSNEELGIIVVTKSNADQVLKSGN